MQEAGNVRKSGGPEVRMSCVHDNFLSGAHDLDAPAKLMAAH
jgi:hypothetical protein